MLTRSLTKDDREKIIVSLFEEDPRIVRWDKNDKLGEEILKHLPHRTVMEVMYPLAWQVVVKIRPDVGSLMLISINVMLDAANHTEEQFRSSIGPHIDENVTQHILEASEAIGSIFPEDEWQSGE